MIPEKKGVLMEQNKSFVLRRRTWAEIDLDAAEANYRAVRDAVPEKTAVCCVIKANAYGHGAVRLGRLYETLGAAFLAVSNVEEALQLRRGGVSLPVLILGYTPEACAPTLAREGIRQCVYSLAYGRALADAAESAGVTVKIHVKLDTGMGRIGFLCRGGESTEIGEAAEICSRRGLDPEGVFTHFAVADEGGEGEAYTRRQYENFLSGVRALADRGVSFRIRHCANSAAIFDYPELHLDMVRAGVVLYGLRPSGEVKRCPPLRPVMTVRSVISHIKTLYPGESLSYGRIYTAAREMRVATVPVGYADGFWRSNGAAARLRVGGGLAPIVGRVCMDQLMIDVTDVPCSVGDPVEIFGASEPCTAQTLAKENGTIPYEIVCALGERVPRAYLRGGRIIAWNDMIYDEDLEEGKV